MIKNITPKQVGLFSALVLGTISFLVLFLGKLSNVVIIDWYNALLFGVLTFLISYFLIIYILRRFI